MYILDAKGREKGGPTSAPASTFLCKKENTQREARDIQRRKEGVGLLVVAGGRRCKMLRKRRKKRRRYIRHSLPVRLDWKTCSGGVARPRDGPKGGEGRRGKDPRKSHYYTRGRLENRLPRCPLEDYLKRGGGWAKKEEVGLVDPPTYNGVGM